MSVKQKLLATILTVAFLAVVFYIVFIYFDECYILTNIDQVTHPANDIYIIHEVPLNKERYKIINIIYEGKKIYAIVHLDNGNIKLVPFSEAYIEPGLTNVLEGYLYRENGQIYIKKE